MPQPCKVCIHDARDLIDVLIVQGIPNRRISSQFSMSEASVRRHVKNHLPATLLKAKAAQDAAHAGSLFEKINRLESDARRCLEDLRRKGDIRGAVSTIGELRRITELLARLGVDLVERQKFNVHQDPAWCEIRTHIAQALQPYPEAKDAVINVLTEISND